MAVEFIIGTPSEHIIDIKINNECCLIDTEIGYLLSSDISYITSSISIDNGSSYNDLPFTLSRDTSDIKLKISYNGEINAVPTSIQYEFEGCIDKKSSIIPIEFKDNNSNLNLQDKEDIFFCQTELTQSEEFIVLSENVDEINVSISSESNINLNYQTTISATGEDIILVEYKVEDILSEFTLEIEVSANGNSDVKEYTFTLSNNGDYSVIPDFETPVEITTPEELIELDFITSGEFEINDIISLASYFNSAQWENDKLLLELNPLLEKGETEITLSFKDICGLNIKDINITFIFLCGFGDNQINICVKPDSINLKEGVKAIKHFEIEMNENYYFCCNEEDKTDPIINVSLEESNDNIQIRQIRNCNNKWRLDYNGEEISANDILINVEYCNGKSIDEIRIPIEIKLNNEENECSTLDGLNIEKISNTGVSISWDLFQSNRSSINIEYYPTNNPSNKEFINEDIRNNSIIDINNLIENIEYTFKITHNCIDNVAEAQYLSIDLRDMEENETCNQIEELTIQSISPTTVDFTWTYNLTTIISYYPVDDPNDISTFNTLDNQATITGLDSNTSYNFIFAGDCPTTADILQNILTPPLPCERPAGLTYTSLGGGSALLSWNEVDNAVGYVIEFKNSLSSQWSFPLFRPGGSNTTYRLDNLIENTTYNFRVKSVCDSNGNESGYSSLLLSGRL